MQSSPHRTAGYLILPIIRIGECNACVGKYEKAWCCTDLAALPMSSAPLDTETAEYLTVRGLMLTEDRRVTFNLVHPCNQYDAENRKCKIYDQRPRTCRNFPQRPEQIWFGEKGDRDKFCSYDFDIDLSKGIELDLLKLVKVMELE